MFKDGMLTQKPANGIQPNIYIYIRTEIQLSSFGRCSKIMILQRQDAWSPPIVHGK